MMRIFPLLDYEFSFGGGGCHRRDSKLLKKRETAGKRKHSSRLKGDFMRLGVKNQISLTFTAAQDFFQSRSFGSKFLRALRETDVSPSFTLFPSCILKPSPPPSQSTWLEFHSALKYNLGKRKRREKLLRRRLSIPHFLFTFSIFFYIFSCDGENCCLVLLRDGF